MRRVVIRLVKSLLPFELSRALGVITCAASANALIAFEQQLNHLVGGAISDCVGAQIIQFSHRWRFVRDSWPPFMGPKPAAIKAHA
jgi:hypothetical protein